MDLIFLEAFNTPTFRLKLIVVLIVVLCGGFQNAFGQLLSKNVRNNSFWQIILYFYKSAFLLIFYFLKLHINVFCTDLSLFVFSKFYSSNIIFIYGYWSYFPNSKTCYVQNLFYSFVLLSMHSASVENSAIWFCFLDRHANTFLPYLNRFPIVDFLSLTQLVTQDTVNTGSFDISILNFKCFVVMRYMIRFSMAPSLLSCEKKSSFPICFLLLQYLVSLVSLWSTNTSTTCLCLLFSYINLSSWSKLK